MRFKIIWLASILSFLYIGCSTSPEFKRESTYDPGSVNFEPHIGSLQSELSSNKTIKLIWSDESIYEDGFIISKSFTDNINFFGIDTLPPNTTSFVDSSSLIDFNTHYKVTAYSANSDSLKGRYRVVSINFGRINNVRLSSLGEGLYEVRWDYDDLKAESILIEKFIDKSSEWIKIDTVSTNEDGIRFNDHQDTGYLSIKISARITNFEGKDQIVDIVRENYLR